MSENPVVTQKNGPVLEVTINRPKANAIDAQTSRILGDVFAEFRDDPDMRVAIVTGHGEKFFCAGWDLKAAAQGEAPDSDYGVGGFGGLQELPGLNKPVIAAVNGWALGGGLEISLACDIVIAAEHARFGCPEPRIGGVPTGAIHRLVRQVPWKTAMAMLYTGQPLDADEAYRAGLVNEVVPAHELLATAEQWALEITKSAPLGVQAAKEVARLGDGLSVQAAMEQSYAAIERVRASKDSVEGRKAFAEKRAPHWRGQ
jgi:crotonobetainyl-CoA hydratase